MGRQPAPEEAVSTTDEQSSQLPKGAGGEKVQQVRVAILDDERAQSLLLGELLSATGYQTQSFSEPTEAIRAVATGEFDVLLTDLLLGSATGWQVARRVKALRPEVKVVVVTAWPVWDSPELAAGDVDAVLQKPYQMSEIRRVMETVLGRETQ